MRLLPQQVLETWGIDQESRGARLWLELCYQMARGRGCGEVAREIMGREHLETRAFYGMMKAALRPVLEADAEALEYFEMPLTKRTTTELARVLAAHIK